MLSYLVIATKPYLLTSLIRVFPISLRPVVLSYNGFNFLSYQKLIAVNYTW